MLTGTAASRLPPSRIAPVWKAPVTPSPLAPAYGGTGSLPLAVTGSFGCEGAAITADEKNGYRQHDSDDHPERPRQPEDVHRAASLQRSRDRASLNVDAEHRIIGARALRIRASLSDRRTRGDVAAWAGDGTAARERRTRRYQDSPRTQEGAHELFGARIGGSANPHPPPQQPVERPPHRPSSHLAVLVATL